MSDSPEPPSRRRAASSSESENDWDETVSALPGDLEMEGESAKNHAYLVVVRGTNVGTSYPMVGKTMVIGRGAGVDVRLNDEGVSRFHCKLHHDNDQVVVEDMGSRNGTYCNGERVLPGRRVLVEGDRLQIGTMCVFRFTYVEEVHDTGDHPRQDPVDDPLTGALSRRAFIDRLEAEVGAALEGKLSLSLVLVHVDRFADIAADEGQDVLDGIIVDVANHIRSNSRPDDVLARIGPADFALLLLRASPGDTFMFAERLRQRAFVPGAENAPPRIALSLGVAAIHELHIESAHDFLVAAGSALHRARSRGGNRTVLCTPELVREPESRATLRWV